MKNCIFFLTFSFLLSFSTTAQEALKETGSVIREVKIFSAGAQVQRNAEVTLEKGINKVVFTEITRQLNPSSIQVQVSPELTILSVVHKESLIINHRKAPIIKMLEDSLMIVELQLEKERNNKYVLEQVEDVLMKNKELKGDKGLNLIDLEDVLELYRVKLSQTRNGLLESKIREKQLLNRLNILKMQLTEFKKSYRQPVFEIIVTLSSAMRKQENIKVNYFVHGASWVPFYDLRAKGMNKAIKLSYKAEVYNNTGENWNNVMISLSTGNPNIQGNPPVLNNQILSFGPNMRGGRTDKSMLYKNENMEYEEDVNIFDNTTTIEFKLPNAVNIAANNQAQLLDINNYELKADFQYYAVPKIEPAAFLLAKVTGWENLNLLSGNANIYFEGTFVGNALIDPSLTRDTLALSFGRDNRIVVQRELSEYSSKNFTGSRIKEQVVYAITIRNNKPETIEIEIEDQVPIASNKEIDVKITNISGGGLNQENGKLSWIRTIESGKTIEIRVEYEVTYPKNKRLTGL